MSKISQSACVTGIFTNYLTSHIHHSYAPRWPSLGKRKPQKSGTIWQRTVETELMWAYRDGLNVLVKLKLQHPPPRQSPRHLNFWRFACSNFLTLGQNGCSNAPPISTEIPLLKDKFHLQSNTVHTFQSGDAIMTPSNFL